jgi:glucose/arabinose dehydrogenase
MWSEGDVVSFFGMAGKSRLDGQHIAFGDFSDLRAQVGGRNQVMKYRWFMIVGLVAGMAWAQEVHESMQGFVVKPAKLDATAARLATLKLPEGFQITKFAEKVDGARMMAVAADGALYVTKRGEAGEVRRLRDTDGDGRADENMVVAKIPHVHGIAIRDDRMWLAAVRDLYVADIRNDGTLSEPRRIVDDLPDAGQHPNRTLAFSPKGELFLSVGSTCNAAPEPNKESATMLRVAPDGSSRTIFASGLRNTIGFDWHPQTGELWGMDHGIDWLGSETQKEELNRLVEGGKYGWPFVFEEGKPNPADDPKETTGLTWEEYAKTCQPSVLGYDAHAAPMALVFYKDGNFPKEYRGDAFVTLHGSWNRKDPRGYELARVRFERGKPVAFEKFLSGFFVPGEGQFGRPCGLVQAPDGSLLMSDDSGGTIYRIAYTGSAKAVP